MLTHDDVRSAGGIVHSDGNIFFTNIDKLNAMLTADHCDPSCTVYKLAEMVMSDCGHSSNNQRLMDRIAERIERYCEARLSAAPAAQPDRDWTPAPENINALPDSVRQYISELETNCDPAGTVRSLSIALDTIRALEASNRMLRDAAPAAQPMTEQEIAYGFEVWQSSPAPEGWHFASDKTRARVAFMDGVRYAEKRLGIKEQP